MGPNPSVAAVRLAVRRGLSALPHGDVLVACSGGADSLALLTAAVFERRGSGRRVVGAVVDHGAQPGSGEYTARVVRRMSDLGVDESVSARVTVDPAERGFEAGAREARYAALSRLARERAAAAVLLGHTRDDQAETVLLGLTQGSGPRSLAGMRRRFGDEGVVYLRPLLDLTREQTRQACRGEAVEWWEDPHNEDPRFTRTRIRHRVMPLLEDELGPGVAGALARTAHLISDDLAALDAAAARHLSRLESWSDLALEVGALELLERAVRTRVLRLAALEAGALPRELTYGHIESLHAMVESPRGPRELHLPGQVSALRGDGVIRFVSTAPPGGPAVAG